MIALSRFLIALGRGVALNKALLFQHIQALRRAGRHREALAELEGNPLLAASPEFTIPLAELYAAFGRERDAYALLEREARSGSANRRAAAAKLRELAIQLSDHREPPPRRRLLGSVPAPPLKPKVRQYRRLEKGSGDLAIRGRRQRSAFAPAEAFLSFKTTCQPAFGKQELAPPQTNRRRNRSLAPSFMSCEGNLRKNSGRGEIS